MFTNWKATHLIRLLTTPVRFAFNDVDCIIQPTFSIRMMYTKIFYNALCIYASKAIKGVCVLYAAACSVTADDDSDEDCCFQEDVDDMVIDDLINDPDYVVEDRSPEFSYNCTGKELSDML